MKRFLIIASTLGVVHFVLSWICFTRSEVIRPNAATPLWRSATEILAFPLLYLQKLNPGFDAFALMMILNSALWGLVIAGLASIIWIVARKSQAPG